MITDFRDAELLAARFMRQIGFSDAAATQVAHDGGVDVAAREAVAQVKMHAAVTGSPDLQRLVGARGSRNVHQQMLFFSLAGYSDRATTYAEEEGMALFVYDRTGRIRPVNGAARVMYRNYRPPVPRRDESVFGWTDENGYFIPKPASILVALAVLALIVLLSALITM
ncbi:restriction endonuclease [Rhodococcus ruber]|uniref:restriction endonuclease n=1 Tax=Rhodococcus TaxID=1827 RepID=UPI000EB6ECA0|nr:MULTISPECIES: restriction endonuclease [Rhodococcus]AXY52486.1 hypothetical protein YT1_3081 [Rhodococcus ruber]UQB70800.1 restriction endonuclease [Rhodococcus ruber]WML65447.1 restriction endonuclease [Rhodococcus sp. AH-ZY2]